MSNVKDQVGDPLLRVELGRKTLHDLKLYCLRNGVKLKSDKMGKQAIVDRAVTWMPHICGHAEADTACRGFKQGSDGQCVYCAHKKVCHPGPGATCEIGSTDSPS